MFKAKRKLVITSLIAMIGVLVGALSVSLTWFAKMNSIEDLEIGGSVLSEYFDSGDGTAAKPFVITRPKHWENLVWLHNNVSGFFQAIRDGEQNQQSNNKGYYFQVGKLNTDLNDNVYYVYDYNADGTIRNNTLTSRTLVLTTNNYLIPIGCSTKPFIGELNGNGITVSGFHVLGFEDKNMNGGQDSLETGFCDVGIFGYIGPNSRISDIYFDNFTIHLGGASALRTNDVNYHNNNHHDLTGQSGEPDGTADTVYAGYIAGHIVASTSIEDVYINNCSFVGGTASKSGFGYFGVVEDQQGQIRPTPLEDITEIKTSGDDNNFGGSIDMLGVFDRLQHIFSETTTITQYIDDELVVEDSVTNKVESYGLHYNDSFPWASESDVGTDRHRVMYYKYATTELGGEFTFPDDNDPVGSTGSDGYFYACLYGASSHYTKTVTKYVLLDSWYSCFYISNGNNYLNHRYFSNVQNVTDKEHAAGWNFDNSNHLYTKVLGDNPENIFYLNQVNGTLVTSNTATTTWTKTVADTDDNGVETCEIYTQIGGINYYLDFEDTWCLSPYDDRFTINDGNSNYLKANNDNISYSNVQTEDSATKWFISNPEGSTTVIGYNRNNTFYYLGADYENLVISTTPTTWNVDDDGYYINVSGHNYYLVFENNAWVLRPESAVRLSNNGSNYLNSTDNSTVSNLTNINTVYWQFTSNSGDTQIYYIANGQKKYLCCNGELYIGASGTTWHRNGNGNALYCTIGSIDYYLIYNNGWRVTDLEFYTIHDSDGDYLVANGTNIFSNTTSSSDATHFYFSDTTGTYPIGTINYVYNGSVYYLNAPVNNNSASLQSGDSGITSWSNDGNAIYFQNGTNTFYLDYDNQWIVKMIYQGHCITDGTNYLTVSGTTIGNVTNINNATFFEFSNTTGNPSGTIKAIGTNYYLRNYNNGTLQSSNTSTSWSNDGTSIYNGNYYLSCVSGSWVLTTTRGEGYLISKDGYYMSLSGTSVVPTSNITTLWSGLSGQIRAVGTQYYLYNNVQQDSLSGSASQNGGDWINSGDEQSGVLYWWTGTYTQYIIRNGTTSFKTGYERSQVVPNSSYSLTFNHVNLRSEAKAFSKKNIISSLTQVTMPNITVTQYNANKNASSEYSYTKDYSTSWTPTSLQNCQKTLNGVTQNGGYTSYFPLRVDKDASGNYPSGYAASDKNTGYIVSGANLGSVSDVYQQQFGDIRVSGYPILNVSYSYDTSSRTINDARVYTVADNNNGSSTARVLNSTETGDGNYKNAKKALERTLGGYRYLDDGTANPDYVETQYDNTTVFGLHFMEATISQDHTIRAKKAKVLGKTYYNYELPEDSIDFNVYERGQISFFAGNYFTKNNSFFSLHKIFRDNSKNITDIKEISEVYWHTNKKTKKRYIYKFSDGSCTSADGTYNSQNTTVDSEYSCIFKTKWITNPPTIWDTSSSGKNNNNRRLWYFTIPCNEGEYALGSVAGKTGAYLCYLDIGANGGDSYYDKYKDPEQATTFDVDYRSAGQATTSYCTIEIGADMPTAVSDSNLEIRVSFDNSAATVNGTTYENGIYVIHVTNKTGSNLQLSVLLIDDNDDLQDDYEYAYKIIYQNEDHTTDTILYGEALDENTSEPVPVPYWKRMGIFDIPSQGVATEHDFDDD